MFKFRCKSTVATAVTIFVFFVALVVISPVHSCSLKDKEDVVFFNTFGHRNVEEGILTLNIHGWVFEKKEKSLWRGMARKIYGNKHDFPETDPEAATFKERFTYFFAHNVKDKELMIQIGKKEFQLPASQKNGHFKTVISLPVSELTPLNTTDWVSFRIHDGHTNSLKFSGQCNIIDKTGVSVISDIDDTIKISNILNEREKLRGVFLYPFTATKGTAKAYRQWEAEGAVFHYVTGAPWQLYPFWRDGAVNSGFPDGSFNMTNKDVSLLSIIKHEDENVVAFKEITIPEIIKAHSERKFILVGDCGQQDPEVYAKIYRLFPDQILHIFVREIKEGDMSTERFEKAFKGVPASLWDIFSDDTINLLQDFSIRR